MNVINEQTGMISEPQPMIDTRDAVDWERDYFAFGSDRDNAIGAANDYKFTGNDYDPETGLYYLWHRYYDPELGRFTQVDPKWDAYPGWSPYAYALNNPLKFIDKDGREVDPASPAFQNSLFMHHFSLYLETPSGFAQYSAFQGQKNVLIRYIVQPMDFYLGQHRTGGLDAQGRTIKLIYINEQYLQQGTAMNEHSETTEPAITIFHEGEHARYSPEFTGELMSEQEEHERMGFGKTDKDAPLNIFKAEYFDLKDQIKNKVNEDETHD